MTGASDNADGLQSSHVTVSRKSSSSGEGSSGPGDSSTPQRLILLRAWGRCHINIVPAGLSYSDTSACGTSVVRARAGLKARAWAQALQAWASEI